MVLISFVYKQTLKQIELFKQIDFISTVGKNFMEEQRFSNPEHVHVLTEKNVDDISNVVKKPMGKMTKVTTTEVNRLL